MISSENRNEDEFRKLSYHLPDLIFQFTRRPDGSYYVPIASKGIENIFGCRPEDVKDSFEPIVKVMHPEDQPKILEAIEKSANELIDFAMRSGAPMEVIENLQEMEDEGEAYETIEEIWPDYPTKDDFFFNEDEY